MQDAQTIRDDIAFMRSLAEEARRSPLLGGSSLMLAGLLYGPASFIDWLILKQGTAISPWWQLAPWLAAMAVNLAVLRFRLSRGLCQAGAGSAPNRALAAAWRGVAWTVLALLAATMVAMWRIQSPAVWATFPSLVLALYGGAWSIAWATSGLRWLGMVAAGAFAAAVAVAIFAGSLDVLPVFGAALLLLLALPGWLLMQGEAKARA